MERDSILKLEKWKSKQRRKPLIISGARQVGKTHLMGEFGRHHFPKYHYVNFENDEALCKIFDEDLKPERIVRELSFYLDDSITTESDLLILDEIQACPRALTSLKYFSEDLPELAVCAAGSLLGLQLGESSYPVGKVESLRMYPLSFTEFLAGSGESRYADFLNSFQGTEPIPEFMHKYLWDQLKIYLIVGGLPEIVEIYHEVRSDLFAALKAVRERQTELIGDYLADIAKHSGKQNAMHLERIWKSVPTQLLREQDGSAPKYRFKGVVPGVHTYSKLVGAIDWLETAGLIIKVPIVNSGNLPFTAYAQENRFKLFCFDVGLLGALSQLPPKTIWDYDYGSYKGYIAENFVVQEFRSTGIEDLYCWRERTAEVEFLMEDNGNVLPIEVKSGWVTQAKSLRIFAQKYNPVYRTTLSAKALRLNHGSNAHNCPLYLAGRFPLVPTEQMNER